MKVLGAALLIFKTGSGFDGSNRTFKVSIPAISAACASSALKTNVSTNFFSF